MVNFDEERRNAGLGRTYTKAWISPHDQVRLLESRGLMVGSMDDAIALLEHVNYYRLSGYCNAFEVERHKFAPEACIEHVGSAHAFDMSLRRLFDQALEIVEIEVRARIAGRFGQRYAAFGHCRTDNFHAWENCGGRFRHGDWLERAREEAQRSREVFVQHFSSKYREFPDLPIWMLTEVLSFGLLSRMFAGMSRQDQRDIASPYGLQPRILQSWLHHFVYVRNICAHHARLWDRIWSVRPQLPPHPTWQEPCLTTNQRPYVTLLMLAHVVSRIAVQRDFMRHWKREVIELLTRIPEAPAAADRLGLPREWVSHPLWRV